MSNIVTNLISLSDSIVESTLNLVNKNTDQVIESIIGQALCVELNDILIIHTEAPRYSNGQLVAKYYDGKLLSEEDKTKLLEAYNNKVEVIEHIKYLVNYIKITVHNASLMANHVNVENPIEELYFLVKSNLPKFILEDKELLKKAFEDEEELEFFLNTTQGNLKEEHINEFHKKTSYKEIDEIFDKYYTLNLLTNM